MTLFEKWSIISYFQERDNINDHWWYEGITARLSSFSVRLYPFIGSESSGKVPSFFQFEDLNILTILKAWLFTILLSSSKVDNIFETFEVRVFFGVKPSLLSFYLTFFWILSREAFLWLKHIFVLRSCFVHFFKEAKCIYEEFLSIFCSLGTIFITSEGNTQ